MLKSNKIYNSCCPVCLEDFRQENGAEFSQNSEPTISVDKQRVCVLTCGHGICRECTTAYVSNKLKQNKSEAQKFQLDCPNCPVCCVPIPMEKCREVAPVTSLWIVNYLDTIVSLVLISVWLGFLGLSVYDALNNRGLTKEYVKFLSS